MIGVKTSNLTTISVF